MANPNKMTRADLVNFAANLATAVANGMVSGFLAAQNTAFSDAVTDANALLDANETDAVNSLATYQMEVHEAQDAAVALRLLIQNVKDAMRAVNSPGSEYVALGFDMPVFDRQVVIPETPTDLAAFGTSNGVNQLSFVSHNIPGTVTFAIQAIIGDTADYILVGTTTQQKWNHLGVVPGQFYQYRVRAQAARNVVSDWSNEAVVYGHP